VADPTCQSVDHAAVADVLYGEVVDDELVRAAARARVEALDVVEVHEHDVMTCGPRRE
jgi:hypothetical protein